MNLKLSHLAIACDQVERVAALLSSLSLEISEEHDVPTEAVKAAMIPVDVSEEFRIELLEPTSENSPIAKFLQKKPSGGLHHVCFEVTDIERWRDLLVEKKMEILPPGIRKAARGRALFLHPKSMGGVLVELEELAN